MDLHPSHVGVSIALKHLLTLRPVPTYLSDVFTCLVPALADDALPFSTHEDLLHHLDAAEGGETLAAAVEMTLGTIRKEGADALMTFVYDFRRLIGDRPTPLPPSSAIDGATDGTMIDRRSPIGIFVRRMALAFHKLPYHGVLALVRDLIRWTGGEDGAEMRLDDDQRVEVGMPPDARWRAEAMADDDALPLRLDAYESYERAVKAGNHTAAHDSLRRFMDYRFLPLAPPRPQPKAGSRHVVIPKPKERALHQHALLNIASLLYEEGGLQEAKVAVSEAIRISRHVLDKECLAACLHLSRRINQDDPHPDPDDTVEPDRLPAGAIPPAPGPSTGETRQRSAIDELFGVEKSLHGGAALSTLNAQLLRVKLLGHREMAISSLGDPTGTPGRITWSPAAWHAITAQIYELQGQTALAAFHRRLALEAGTNDDVRLAVLAAQAERLAHAGDFDEARSLLIGEAPKLLDMSLRDVIRWQRSVYSIFRLQAERGHFRSVLEQLDRLCPPAPTGQRVPMHPLHAAPLITPRPSRRDETLEISLSSPTYTSRLLARATRLLDEKDLTNALSPLLDALSRTTTPTPAVEGKPAVVHDTPDLLPLHLRARVLLCRWYLDAGEAEKAKGELGADLVNEVKAIEDIELLAMVTRCRARCKVALASKEREADFLEAASLFAEAAEGFRRASCWDAHRHSLSDLAVVHAERGDIAKRDEAARAWRQAATERLEAERMLTKELEEVQKISVKVSVGVADGTRV